MAMPMGTTCASLLLCPASTLLDSLGAWVTWAVSLWLISVTLDGELVQDMQQMCVRTRREGAGGWFASQPQFLHWHLQTLGKGVASGRPWVLHGPQQLSVTEVLSGLPQSEAGDLGERVHLSSEEVRMGPGSQGCPRGLKVWAAFFLFFEGPGSLSGSTPWPSGSIRRGF